VKLFGTVLLARPRRRFCQVLLLKLRNVHWRTPIVLKYLCMLPLQSMTLTRRAQPFSHPDWLFEIKHDGFRALAKIDTQVHPGPPRILTNAVVLSSTVWAFPSDTFPQARALSALRHSTFHITYFPPPKIEAKMRNAIRLFAPNKSALHHAGLLHQYRFLADGAPPNPGPAPNSNGFTEWGCTGPVLIGSGCIGSTVFMSNYVSVVATVTNTVRNQFHTIEIDAACEGVDGCQLVVNRALARIDVFHRATEDKEGEEDRD